MRILKENKNLRTELKELTAITETWLNSSNKVNQCISEQIPSQKNRITADDTKVSIPGVERPWLSEAKAFILPNHDTSRIFPAESQRNTTDPSVAVTDSSATEYDSADESSVCSTPLPPLKKLDGVEPISGPKTIKSILRSKSTFKAETLKGVKINEPSSAPAKGNKSSSASKVNSALAGKLKSVKIRDPTYWAIVIKELNDLKLQISKNQSSYSRNNQQFEMRKENKSSTPNKEVVKIAPRVRDVYVHDITSSAQEYCFFAKASENLNWLWNKRLAHLNFKTINKLGQLPQQNKQSSIKKCLHLLHMDLFRPVTPMSINHEKYTIFIVDDYSRPSDSSTQEDRKLNKPITSHLMKALMLSNSQNLQLTTSILLKMKDIHLMNIFIIMSLLKVSSDQNGQTDQNDQSVQNDEILNDDHSKHSNHTNDEQIIDNLPNTKDFQISEHSSSLSVEDTSVQDTTPISNPPLPIPSVVTLAPQDRWSQDKHIELVNIIGNQELECSQDHGQRTWCNFSS
ncbi:hypothetical protein Tco_0578739 [Tanacetum coccineum]